MDQNRLTNTAQKMKFSIKDFLVNVTEFAADLAIFTEENLNEKLFVQFNFRKGFMFLYCILYKIPRVRGNHLKGSIKNLLSKFRKVHREIHVLESLF